MTIRRLVKATYLLALAALVLTLAAVRLSGHSLLVVTGGSMEPTIHKGSVVLVQPVDPSDVRVGDVTTFALRGETVTHRVIETRVGDEGRLFLTKGDANPVADPEPKVFADRAGVVRLSVPLVGYAAVYAQAYGRVGTAALACATLLTSLGAMVLRLVERRSTSEQLRRLRLYCTVETGRLGGRAA